MALYVSGYGGRPGTQGLSWQQLCQGWKERQVTFNPWYNWCRFHTTTGRNGSIRLFMSPCEWRAISHDQV